MVRLLILGLRIVAVTAGATLMAYGGKAVIDGLASEYWDAVVGIVQAQAPGAYSYRVADGEYTGHRYSFGGLPQFSRIPGDYRAGSTIAVYYDPSEASRTVLRPGLQRSALVVTGVGVMLLLLAALPGPRSGRRRRDSAPPSRLLEGLIPETFVEVDVREERGWKR